MNKKYNYIAVLIAVTMFSLLTFSQSAFGEEQGAEHEADLKKGKRIYSISCVLCHGSKGKGDGPASVFIGPYSHPRPNDFTRGVFKYRSTESGDLPTLSDLMRTIGYGIPGYMPSFRHLGEEGVRQVALYISDTFIEDELSLVAMDALRDGGENLKVAKNVVAQADPELKTDKASRIEVYKEITAALNNISKNALTAMEKKKDAQPTLNMYKNIITTLNGIVSNLETDDAPFAIGKTGLQPINYQSAGGPIQHDFKQDDVVISLEPEGRWSRSFLSADIIKSEMPERVNASEEIIKSEQSGAALPVFSDLFIGEGGPIWD